MIEAILARERGTGRRVSEIKAELGATMNQYVAVYRDEEGLQQAHEIVARLQEEAESAYVDDRGTVFNQDVLGAIELGYMLDCAEATVVGAIERKESRGRAVPNRLPRAQRREWLKHIDITLSATGMARRSATRRSRSPSGSPRRGSTDGRRSPTATEPPAGTDHPQPSTARSARLMAETHKPPERSRCGCAATTPSPARRPTGTSTRSSWSPTARCSRGSCRRRPSSTARSGSAARAAPRSAARAGCSINGEPGLACHTHLDHARGVRQGDGVIEIEPMGNMPVIKDLIVDMDAVHWKKVQRVTPWLMAKQPVPEREYIVPHERHGRHHPVDGLHPVRRVRVGLPGDGGRPGLHRPGGAGQGLPLRRRPARRPSSASASTTWPRTRRGSTTARTASSASRPAPRTSTRWARSCACGGSRVRPAHRRPQQRRAPRGGVHDADQGLRAAARGRAAARAPTAATRGSASSTRPPAKSCSARCRRSSRACCAAR